jgi:SdrD B-like domain
MKRFLLVAAAGLLGACSNAGEDRLVGITAQGILTGSVFFDANGSGTRDAVDLPQDSVRVIVTDIGGVTLRFEALTDADGRYRITGVPVGTYTVRVDTTTLRDSLEVIGTIARQASVEPADSAVVTTTLGYRTYTVAQARALPLGTNLFLTAIALHGQAIYSDTTLHLADTSGSIRAARVRPSATPVVAGDSVRVRARVGLRLGQPILENVTVFTLGPTLLPAMPTLTTASAANAVGGTRDAALVRLLNVPIIDSATVAGSLQLTVNDGSGALVVVLDRAADAAFRAPLPVATYTAGNRFDLIGILAPTGTGSWRLRPRSSLDLTRR